jgi:potassium-transporting ATPase KdpC subunit
MQNYSPVHPFSFSPKKHKVRQKNMKQIITSIKVFIVFSILLGLVYPLAITGIAQIAFPQKANGSLIVENGKVVGSSLIGQKFDAPEYFNSRPSAVDYNAAGSGASNLGPTSKKLMERVKEANEKWKRENGKFDIPAIPADAVLASASGLDPHISLENAQLQAKRIAKIRKISEEKINKLISQNTDSNFLGLWGQDGVNVLKLNITLDKTWIKGKL